LVDNRSDSTKMHGATIKFIINLVKYISMSVHSAYNKTKIPFIPR